MDLLDLFCGFLTLTLTLAFDTKMKLLKIIFYYTPGLEVQYLHSTGYEPKASDARRFDTRFVLLFKQVIRRNDVIVCPHLQLKIQDSLEDRGKLLVNPPSRTTIIVSQNASVVSCWLTLVTKACHLPFV